MQYTSPTIAWRGKLAQAVNKAHQQRIPTQEVRGTFECPHCRSPLHFVAQANGNTRGQCSSGCGIRWSE